MKLKLSALACALLGQTSSWAFHSGFVSKKIHSALSAKAAVAREKRISNLSNWSEENDVK
jgi:hypothetical protein